MSTPGPVVRCFADIQPEPLDWFWLKRIPRGKLTLFIGDPGQAKSLVTVDLAARCTRGLNFPDGAPCKMGDVVFLSAEDDAADTILPRLTAAGADLRRVHIIEAMRVKLPNGSVGTRMFDLAVDMAALENVLLQHSQVRLIIVDPISAYLGATDSHSNSQVRAILSPLAALAARHKVTISSITHLRKSNGSALHRSIASVAFAAAARSVWAFGPDPDDPSRRLFVPVKQNLSANSGGLAFHVEETAPDVPRVVWDGQTTVEADTLLAVDDGPREDRSALEQASRWLEQLLSGGTVAVKEIRKEARAAGVSWRTIERAKAANGVEAKRTKFDGLWQWYLPKTANTKTAKSSVCDMAVLGGSNGNESVSPDPSTIEDRQHRHTHGLAALGESELCPGPECCAGCYQIEPGRWIHPPKCGWAAQ